MKRDSGAALRALMAMGAYIQPHPDHYHVESDGEDIFVFATGADREARPSGHAASKEMDTAGAGFFGQRWIGWGARDRLRSAS